MSHLWKAGALNQGRYGLSWHRLETEWPSIEQGDDIVTGFEKAGMYGITTRREMTYNVQRELSADEKALLGLPEHATAAIVDSTGADNLVMRGCEWEMSETNPTGKVQIPRMVKNYVPLDNDKLAEALNPLVTEAGLDLAGVMQIGKYGEITAVQLELPYFDVAGQESERHITFLLISSDRLTGKKYYGLVTIRVVCANTYAVAVSGLPNLPQTDEPEKMYQFRSRVVKHAMEERERVQLALTRMFCLNMTEDAFEDLLRVTFPTPKRGGITADFDAAAQMGWNFADLADNDKEVPDDIARVLKKGQRAHNVWKNGVDRAKRDRQACYDLVEEGTADERHNKWNIFPAPNEDHLTWDGEAWTEATPFISLYGAWQIVTGYMCNSQNFSAEMGSKTFQVLFGGDHAKPMERAWDWLNNLVED